MALDTKYRPSRYADVIGQQSTVQVLREFVRKGAGFHQSYLFAGGHGSGKTTLGRILCRALLCEAPVDGEPCDACHSCRAILETGSSDAFTEFDAATNSSKEDVRRITEMASFDTISGRRRVYLIDEAHRLSPQALDALLKPMEDCAPGSEDKLLVCVFCTTEPDRMRKTIFSRCAPVFMIRTVPPTGIAERLAHVCTAESLPFEQQALVLIAEATECHIRDALKAVEGVSMLGGITSENVRSYLRLDSNNLLVELLLALGDDLTKTLTTVSQLGEAISPAVAYERLAEAAMLSYKVHVGVAKPPSYWNAEVLAQVGQRHQEALVRFAEVFASRPNHPTQAMLECDLTRLHYVRRGEWVAASPRPQAVDPQHVARVETPRTASAPVDPAPVSPPVQAMPSATASPPGMSGPVHGKVDAPPPPTTAAPAQAGPEAFRAGACHVVRRGVNRDRDQKGDTSTRDTPATLDPATFRRIVRMHVQELGLNERGRSP